MTNALKSAFYSVSFVVLICTSVSGYSQPGDFTPVNTDSGIAQKISEVSSGISTIQCDFIQIKKMQYLESDLKSRGKFWYVHPDKVRWEYLDPYEYIIILKQENIALISNNSVNQFEVTSNETFRKMNEMIVASVSGRVFTNTDYKTELFESNEFYKVLLQPVSEQINKMIAQLELYFNKDNFALSKIKIIEPNSDFSLIHFSNQLLNEPIQEDIFTP